MTDQPHEFDRHGDLNELDQLLMALYVRHATPVDSLAYSDAFEHIYIELQKAGDRRPKGDVYRRLLMLRKSGRLPRLELHLGGASEID